MEFHLDFVPEKPAFNINHSSGIFLIGSCFSQNIGNLLSSYKFKTYYNPGGILFNPKSIAQCLQSILLKKAPNPKLVISRDNFYFSYAYHSSVKAATKEALLHSISEMEAGAFTFLNDYEYLIITFGTAYYYQLIELNETVGNCHKQPGQQFIKKLLTVDEIYHQYKLLLSDLAKFNPNLKVLLTISPVKHLNDGIVENNMSKSTLTLAVHKICESHTNCSYFPAFELVTDDLRDYRFYKKDMAHPNEQAIEYVWEKFSQTFFSAETKHLNQKILKLNQAIAHRPGLNNDPKLNEYILKLKEELRSLKPNIVL